MAKWQTFCSFMSSCSLRVLAIYCFWSFICGSNIISSDITSSSNIMNIYVVADIWLKSKRTFDSSLFFFLKCGNNLLELHSPGAMVSFHQSVSPPLCNQVCLWAISSANHSMEGWLTEMNLHPCEQSSWDASALPSPTPSISHWFSMMFR